jgi:hypothetical protein
LTDNLSGWYECQIARHIRAELKGVRAALDDYGRVSRELAIRAIWLAYLPDEPLEVAWQDLQSCRAAIYWSGKAWTMVLRPNERDWKSEALHELAHVKLGHQVKRLPPAGTVRGDRLDEKAMNATHGARSTVDRWERDADAWAISERPRWA